jgi:hypothetical protein
VVCRKFSCAQGNSRSGASYGETADGCAARENLSKGSRNSGILDSDILVAKARVCHGRQCCCFCPCYDVVAINDGHPITGHDISRLSLYIRGDSHTQDIRKVFGTNAVNAIAYSSMASIYYKVVPFDPPTP